MNGGVTVRFWVTLGSTPLDELDQWRRTPATVDDWPQTGGGDAQRGVPDGGDVSSRLGPRGWAGRPGRAGNLELLR